MNGLWIVFLLVVLGGAIKVATDKFWVGISFL